MSKKAPTHPYLKKFVMLGLFILPIVALLYHPSEKAFADALPKVTVTASTLNVRSLPSLNSQVIGTVHKREIYNVRRDVNGWDQIQLGAKTGWVKSDYVKAASDQVQMGVVSAVNGLNVHQSANLHSSVVSLLTKGMVYPYLKQKGDLIEVDAPNGPGWVTAKLVTLNQITQSTGNRTAVVIAHSLNIREAANVTSPIIGSLSDTNTITVLGEQTGWAMIKTVSGNFGWVSEAYLKFSNKVDSPSKDNANYSSHAFNKVKQILGIPSQTIQNNEQTNAPEKDISNNSNTVSTDSLKGKTIVLDPGHGGIDNGTTGVNGTPEKVLTLGTAEKVKAKLEAAGARVVMTRDNDSFQTLQARSDLSNQVKADAFISFHYNSSPVPSSEGIMDFYYSKEKDERLATDVLDGVLNTTGLQSRGNSFDNLYVLRNNNQPSTLIELGFLSNKSEDAKVDSSDYQAKVALGVYEGLIAFFSGQ